MKSKSLRNKPHKFILCGLTGWCLEILYTAFSSEKKHSHTLIGHTSIWMFPIYGSLAFLTPLCRHLKQKNLFLRGSLYTCFIYIGEYVSGTILKKHHACPWDYSKAPYNINGIIRLDYAPLWFLTGLLFEKILR